MNFTKIKILMDRVGVFILFALDITISTDTVGNDLYAYIANHKNNLSQYIN